MVNTRRQFIRATAVAGLGSLAGCGGTATTDSTGDLTGVRGWPSVFHDGRNTNHNPHATPPASEPQVVWRATDHTLISRAAQTRVLSAVPRPIITDGRLYLGGRTVACYDAETGATQWRREYDNRFIVGLAAVNGRLHAVEREIIGSETDLPGHLSAVDTATGRREHATDCGTNPAVPVTDGERLVVPTESGHVGFDGAGVRRWAVSRQHGSQPHAAPTGAFTGDSLYLPFPLRFSNYDRTDTVDSIQQVPNDQWGFDLGYRQRLHPPTVVDNGTLVPVSQGPATGVEWQAVVQPGLHAYNPDGTHRWRLPFPAAWTDGNPTDTKSEYAVSTPAVGDGVGYVLSSWIAGGETTEQRSTTSCAALRAFDVASGTERWRVSFPGYGGSRVSPVVADGRVYSVLGSVEQPDQSSRLVAHDRGGEHLWRLDLPARALHLAVVGELLYVTLRDRVVAYGPQ